MASAKAARRRSEHIGIDLELHRVRKGKGVVHLTVVADPARAVETLCERRFEPGDYELTDLEPSCAACLRRREDPSRLSNAMFGSDLGSRLLELSLTQARKRPEDARADEKAAKAEPPRLRVISTEPPAAEPPRAPTGPARARESAPPRPMNLDLSAFESLGGDRYRSPGGVVVQVVRREGGGWDVGEVEFEGKSRLEQLEDGRVRIRIGDLRFEYSGEIEGRVRRD